MADKDEMLTLAELLGPALRYAAEKFSDPESGWHQLSVVFRIGEDGLSMCDPVLNKHVSE